MKDAHFNNSLHPAHLNSKSKPKLPLWPPRVKLPPCRRRHEVADEESQTKRQNRTNMFLAETKQKLPRFLQHRPGRLRRRFTFVVFFAFITIAFLLTWLYRDGDFGALDTLFKKTTTIRLAQGTYIGEVLPQGSRFPRAIQAFRGIPYAQSTAGQNRFKTPQPLKGAHDGIQRAVSWGNICPQKGGGSGQGEDCLNLNLYRPHFGDDLDSSAIELKKQGLDGKKWPVVVFVPGGAFNMGCGRDRNMASFAAWSETPVITISFNYRLGAFGFLPSALTAKAGLLNLGLRDQQFLFEWVRANIADVGGDPNNVTIMGQSAGAHSVGHHLISYSPANKLIKGDPPFQKAIMESGGSTARAVFVANHPLHEQQFQEFIMHCGLDNVPDDQLFDELRKLPLSVVSSASGYLWSKWSDTLRWPFQPVIDGPGGLIPDLPINSWAAGNVLRIPILTGFNTNEGTDFVPTNANNASALTTLMSSIIPAMNQSDLNTLDTMYPAPSSSAGQKRYTYSLPSGYGSQFWRLDDAYAHYAYICPVLQTAHLASTAADAAPVYAYHYAARSKTHGGADHSDETPIVVHDVSQIGQYPGLVATADAMVGTWSRFAATGDPNNNADAKNNGDYDDASKFEWPRFVSPFANGTGIDLNLEKKSESEAVGMVAFFGEGNTERMLGRGKGSKGVPAQAIALTDREKSECEFWWNRVVLSQGYANGTASIKGDTAIRAKL
ncbi:Alpha/Beta hydrolase protein [Xylariaceae sp. FL0016]|nr:Alpha/Beta hydrolase protein [Xylariaceae sp. FL0016]